MMCGLAFLHFLQKKNHHLSSKDSLHLISAPRKATTVKLGPPQLSAAHPSPAQSSSAKPAKPTLAHRNLASADKQREAGKFILAQPLATLLNPAQLSPSPAQASTVKHSPPQPSAAQPSPAQSSAAQRRPAAQSQPKPTVAQPAQSSNAKQASPS